MEKENWEKLYEEKERYRIITDMVSDALWAYAVKEDCMRYAMAVEGEFPKEKCMRDYSQKILRYVYEEDQELFSRFLQEMKDGKTEVKVEARMRGRNLHFSWIGFQAKGIQNSKNELEYIGRIYRLEEQKEAERKLYDEAKRDSLTGLWNKMFVQECIEQHLQNYPKEAGALLVMDIDNFKKVNDTQGHLFGDEVLEEVSKVLHAVFRSSDIIGRIGGDEFVIYMKSIDNLSMIKKKAKNAADKVAAIYTGENKACSISASIGIALYPKHGKSYVELFTNADNSLYYIKNNGKNSYVIYEEGNEEIERGGRGNGEQENEYTTYDKEGASKDVFAYELTDFTFQLMEETKDVDSAMNLLLRKVQNYYDFSRVIIYGNGKKTEQTVICECVKESLKEGKRQKVKSQTLLEIPLYQDKQKVGSVQFMDDKKKRKLKEEEQNTLKAFCRIISSYLLNMKAYQDTEQLVEQMSEQDLLTGLLRYEVFLERFEEEVKKDDTRDILIAYSDISHFKYVNDIYGYSTGDKLLQSFAKEVLDSPSLVLASRVYSDNLVAVSRLEPDTVPEELLERIRVKNDLVAERLQAECLDGKLTINTGIYILKDKTEDIQSAISNANFARKEAKKAAGVTAVLYNEQEANEMSRQVRLVEELPRAIKNRELVVYYQPKIACGSNKVIGAEALIRWKKPDGTFIYPDEFIPIFEENGSVVEVDYFVYREVFQWIRKRLDQNLPVVPVSMNVSRIHMQNSKILDYIEGLIKEYQVPPQFVEFELTENIYIADFDKVLPLVERFRTLGIKVSMDDFGSGYSSLNVLNKLPIDILKLDKVFMRNSLLEESERTIIAAIIDMAKRLNITVLCEGIETVEQNEFLSRVGCDIIQGYYFAKPMEVSKFEKYLEEHQEIVANEVRFTFHDTLEDTTGKYRGIVQGKELSFTDGWKPGTRALHFPGGKPEQEVLILPEELMTNSSYTMAFWMKADEMLIWQSVVYCAFNNGFMSIMPKAWDAKGVFRIRQESQGDIWHDCGNQVISAGEWVHLAAVYDAQSKTSNFYLNGQRVGYREDVTSLYMAKRLLIGGDIYKESFHGDIANLRIFNQALSGLTIQNIYEEEASE